MSDLERVMKELTRLTERLREVNSRKTARTAAVRDHRDRVVQPRSPVARLQRDQRIS